MGAPIVRGVCAGNIQRSPSFEAVFRWTASEMSLPIKFDGAGYRVDKIMKNQSPLDKQADILKTGKSYGLDYEIPNDEEGIRVLYAEFKDRIHTKMMEYRNQALREVGTPEEFLPGMRVPFRHGKGIKLILAMDRLVIPKLEKYYVSIDEDMPKAMLYGDLVGEEELHDELVGKMDLARRQVDYFMQTRYKAIDKIGEML